MGEYRKRPVVVEAMQFDGTEAGWEAVERWADLPGRAVGWVRVGADVVLTIETLEGTMHASPGDWIIKGIKGEFYPCKPDIFAATYEAVSPTPAAPAGSGWLTQPADFVPYGKESWQQEAVAQRAAREAAERERDEWRSSAMAHLATWTKAADQRDEATARAERARREWREWQDRYNDCRERLAASTEREAGLLRAINWAMGCGDADDFPTSEPGKRFNWRPGLASRAGLVYDKEAGRYVLAAPEGGTTDG